MLNVSSLPLIQRDLARYHQSCVLDTYVGRVTRQFLESYHRLGERGVLLIDASRATEWTSGVGNLFGDYLTWLGLAAASRRALFIDWTRGLEARRPVKHVRYDLSRHFSGATPEADWAWSQSTRARVRQRYGNEWRWLRWNDSSAPCERVWRALADRSSPLLAIELASVKRSGGMPASKQVHVGMLPRCSDRSPRASGGRTQSWNAQCDGLSLTHCAARALTLHATWLQGRGRGTGSVPTVATTEDRRPLWRQVLAVRGNASAVPADNRAARAGRCLLHAMMRPRPKLLAELQPYLERLGRADSLVAFHIRSGWADDLSQLPASLGTTERIRALKEMLSPNPARDQTARGCGEATAEAGRRVPSCGLACPCRPPLPSTFAAGLREVLTPHQHGSEPWYGGYDPLHLLRNATARWSALVAADSPSATWSGVRRGVRRDRAEADRAMEVRIAAACGGGVPPGDHAWRPPEPRAAASTLSQMVECAVRLAQTIAHRRRSLRSGGESGGHGGAESADGSSSGWALVATSDSPGLVKTITQLPGLEGRAVGCLGRLCEDRGEVHSGRSRPDSDASIQVSIDLWLHGVADHLIPATVTTFSHCANEVSNSREAPHAQSPLRSHLFDL